MNTNSPRMTNPQNPSGIRLDLSARPERHLIRPGGSARHMDFVVQVGHPPSTFPRPRLPLRLALVLDRSGSMAGEKLATAKQAALAVTDQLDERDQVALIAFDDRIEVVQPLSTVTPQLKRALRPLMERIEARASTALHEGWLTGAQQVAPENADDAGRSLTRVFLLTDGIANVGLQDPEQIASQAADVREKAGVGTSTFGIGEDYNEGLLAPMAVAGGGQFHHLRDPSDIAATFIGELGDLLGVVASQVSLELRIDPTVEVEVISAYRLGERAPDDRSDRHVLIGDLLAGDERHVVVRFLFPRGALGATSTIQAGLRWVAEGREQATGWEEVRFVYADHPACDTEVRDPQVMHWVGLHHAERARQQATALSRRGDRVGAQEILRKVGERIAAYAGNDADLLKAVVGLAALREELGRAPIDAMRAKELTYQSTRTTRGQKDYRNPPPTQR